MWQRRNHGPIRVVSDREEPDRHIISQVSHAHNVTDDGVIKVVGRISRAADDLECMTIRVDTSEWLDAQKVLQSKRDISMERPT